MSFFKTGAIFKIASSREINYSDWQEFKKQASVTTKESVIEKKQTIDKDADLEIVASVDTDNFIYIHSTIMAGVKTAVKDYWITQETEKFINDNHDAWTCEDLMIDHKSFKTATTFVEHCQELEKARGKCVDVIARKLPDTILVDVLFSVAKRHADLVENIKTGIINAVSMGCSTEKTICSICGNEAADKEQYCSHIKANNKGRPCKCSDGKLRKAAEICKGNTFFDISLVANPAFAGAVFRKILSSEQIGTQLLANLVSNKIESFKSGELLLKAASKDADVELTKDGYVTITAGEKSFKEQLPEQEINSIKSVLGNEKSATKFLSKIINKFFGKSAEHPILNTSPSKDFTTSYHNYSEIPWQDRHKTVDDFKNQDMIGEKRIEMTASRTETFKCYSCKFEDELWQIRAASIDKGYNQVIVCPKCGFITEKDFTNAQKLSTIDSLQLKDLGYSLTDLEKLSSSQITTILSKDLTKEDFFKKADVQHSITKALQEDPKKYEETLEKFEAGQQFIANADIPVDNDEGILHFDEHGSSVITKSEKLSFVASVENGEYGLFRTELGEEFFMPIAQKKSNVVPRPDEFHGEFDAKPNQYKHNRDVMNSGLTDTGKDLFKDKRDDANRPAMDNLNPKHKLAPIVVNELVKEEFAING